MQHQNICVCVCVCVRAFVCVYVCVCEREREIADNKVLPSRQLNSQSSLGYVRLGQVGLGWVGLGQVRLGWVGLGWVKLGQVGLGWFRLGQVRLVQVRLDIVTLSVYQKHEKFVNVHSSRGLLYVTSTRFSSASSPRSAIQCFLIKIPISKLFLSPSSSCIRLPPRLFFPSIFPSITWFRICKTIGTARTLLVLHLHYRYCTCTISTAPTLSAPHLHYRYCT